jgi:hypothetical protein
MCDGLYASSRDLLRQSSCISRQASIVLPLSPSHSQLIASEPLSLSTHPTHWLDDLC